MLWGECCKDASQLLEVHTTRDVRNLVGWWWLCGRLGVERIHSVKLQSVVWSCVC